MSQSLRIKITQGVKNELIGSSTIYVNGEYSAPRLVAVVKSVLIDDSEELLKYRELDECLCATLLIEEIGTRLSKGNQGGNDEQYNSLDDEHGSIVNRLKGFFGKNDEPTQDGSKCKNAYIEVNIDTKVIDAQITYA